MFSVDTSFLEAETFFVGVVDGGCGEKVAKYYRSNPLYTDHAQHDPHYFLANLESVKARTKNLEALGCDARQDHAALAALVADNGEALKETFAGQDL